MLVRLKPLYFDILFGNEISAEPKKNQQSITKKQEIIKKYKFLMWELLEIRSVSIAGESFNLYILKGFPKELPIPFADEIEVIEKGQFEFRLD